MRQQTYSCGLDASLDVIGGKWKGLILWALRSEARRFGELRRVVKGISEKMLIQHLKEMEADGIVKRRDFKEVPPRVGTALRMGNPAYEAHRSAQGSHRGENPPESARVTAQPCGRLQSAA